MVPSTLDFTLFHSSLIICRMHFLPYSPLSSLQAVPSQDSRASLVSLSGLEFCWYCCTNSSSTKRWIHLLMSVPSSFLHSSPPQNSSTLSVVESSLAFFGYSMINNFVSTSLGPSVLVFSFTSVSAFFLFSSVSPPLLQYP